MFDQSDALRAELLRGDAPVMDGDLHDDGDTVLVRRKFKTGGGLLYRSSRLDGAPAIRQRLQREFDLRERLQMSWATVPTELEASARSTVMMMTDPGGILLKESVGWPWEIEPFLRAAIGMVEALRRTHDAGLVHNTIHPAHVLVDMRNGRAWLSGFSNATNTRTDGSVVQPAAPAVWALPYASPELCGRTGGPIDARSDLYALGVLLYQLATGSLPFMATDVGEIVRCHLAEQPRPPSEISPLVPPVLEHLILNLLSKAPEDRYPSAVAVEADLRRALQSWEAHRQIATFPLSSSQALARPHIPDRLYGRSVELRFLKNALAQVASLSRAKLVVISGLSGVGKSATIAEFQSSVRCDAAHFASGKAQQFQSGLPQAPVLAGALQSLLKPLLTLPEAERIEWRRRLQQAVLGNGQVIAGMAPELIDLLGAQPALPELSARENQTQFYATLVQFLRAFTETNAPLVLILDDLQWIDSATLASIERILLAEPAMKLLLVCAFRSNEVQPGDPLIRTLETLQTGGIDVEEVFLAPLLDRELEEMVADTLERSRQSCAEISQLIHRLTAGNPLFVTQFIASLADEGLFSRDGNSLGWRWDMARLRKQAHPPDLLALIIERIRRLPQASQGILKLLSCLGSTSPAAILAHASGSSEEVLTAELQPAVAAGLCRRTLREYSFVHDRVHEAAYAMMSMEERSELHLSIARLLLGVSVQHRAAEALADYELLEQFNLGAFALASQDERDKVAELNLKAARRALNSSAHAAARGFAQAGIDLLGQQGLARQPGVTFALELVCAESDFIAGLVDQAETALHRLVPRAMTALESAEVSQRLIELYVVGSRHALAIDHAIASLRLFGIELDAHPSPSDADVAIAAVMASIDQRSFETLNELPLAQDPAAAACMNVLGEIFLAACFTDVRLLIVQLCRMVELTLRHGLTPASPQGIAWFGVMIGQRCGRHAEGYRFAALARDLASRHGFAAGKAKTLLALEITSVWARPLNDAVDNGRQAFEAASSRADLVVACWAQSHTVNDLLFRGDHLDDLAREIEDGMSFAGQLQHREGVDDLLPHQQFVAALRGRTASLGNLETGEFSERSFESRLASQAASQHVTGPAKSAAFQYWVLKAQLRFSAGDFDGAGSALQKAAPALASAIHIPLFNYHFYSILTAGARLHSSSSEDASDTLTMMSTHLEKLRIWRDCNPKAFAAGTELSEAELARCEGRLLDAEAGYERASQLSRNQGCSWSEALANELAASFYAARRLPTIANAYLRQARYAYMRWGAAGKVKLLDREHSWLAKDALAEAANSDSLSEALDFQTVVTISETISSEIDAERVVELLLAVALEHAGAERGSVFLNSDSGLKLEAHAQVLQEGIKIITDEAMLSNVLWPTSVLRVIEGSLQSVLLDNAAYAGRHVHDPYFRKRGTRSVICLPLLKQGRLAGALYLENDLVAGAFTSKRIAVLRLVAAQSAIALENSRLYRDLRRENRVRTIVEEKIRRAALDLSASEERFRAMADATPDVIWISETNPERVLYVSPSFERIWGVSLASLYENAHTWVEGIHPDDRARVGESFAAWVESGGAAAWDIEFRVVQKPSGAVRLIHDRGVFLHDEIGGSRRISGIATDVTDQRAAVIALRKSEERHALAMDAARDGHWDWLAATDEFYASARMLEIYGFPPDTRFNGRQEFLDRFPFYPGEREKWQQEIAGHFASDRIRFEMEVRMLRDGELRWIHLNGLLARDSEGRPTRYTGSVSDITERKLNEAALLESEQRFALATEGSSDGIYDWDLSTDRMFLSHRCQQLYGLEPGPPIRLRAEWNAMILMHPEDAGRHEQMLGAYLAGELSGYDNEWRVLHPDGTYRWLRLRGVCIRDGMHRATRMAGSVGDVDARRRAEAAIQQMQRLEAVGTLAGGVAHDFNNILAVILGFSEAGMRHTRPGSRMRRDLERILSAGERGRALVERILTFSRSSVGARIVVNVEDVVAESVTMIEAMCPRHVNLSVQLASGDATIVGDPTQIHQLVMNLATNGMQAMASGGALRIELSCIGLASSRMTTTGPLQPGDYLALRVQDGGAGIDPVIREKIFDPFFTTKDVGSGTGLGLSLVHGIVTELGGAIDVITEMGVGSCFTAYLPRSGDAAGRQDEAQAAASRGTNERILLVDDEEALVRLSSDMLVELGYRPTAFTSALRALEAFRQSPGAFDAIITDARMPGMTGLQLIKAVREVDAAVPVLLVSGFLAGSAAAEARMAGANVILNKPLARRDLGQALSETLGDPRKQTRT